MSTRVGNWIRRIVCDNLERTVNALARDPLPYRKLNYTVPGHAKSTLEEADEWLERELRNSGYTVSREACQVRAFGCDSSKPQRHQYTAPAEDAPVYTAYNLYAERAGRSHPEEIILLLAHKDSQSWVDSPGAYDNAVGTAAVLEIARVLSDYGLARTIRFLFCNEEHTPWTSIAAAEAARHRGDNLVAIFNTDSIGGKSDAEIAAGLKTNTTLYTRPEGKRFADLMAEVNERYGIGLTQRSFERSNPGDDDGSFIEAGYDHAVANIGSYPYADEQYHLEGDVPGRVDFENVRMAAQAIMAAVLHLDRLP